MNPGKVQKAEADTVMAVSVEVLVTVIVEVVERTRVKNSFPSSPSSFSLYGEEMSDEGLRWVRSVKSSIL